MSRYRRWVVVGDEVGEVVVVYNQGCPFQFGVALVVL
jgi:hypothetical protein